MNDKAKPTLAALKAARRTKVLFINTRHGLPSVQSIADIIEEETKMRELVRAMKNLDNAINEPALGIDVIEASDKARAVIAKAEQE